MEIEVGVTSPDGDVPIPMMEDEYLLHLTISLLGFVGFIKSFY